MASTDSTSAGLAANVAPGADAAGIATGAGVTAGLGVTAAEVALGVVAQPATVDARAAQTAAASEREAGRVIGINRLELVPKR
jgi:hypothetical protein